MRRRYEKSRSGSRFSAGTHADLQIEGTTYRCTAHNLSRSGVLLTGTIPSPGQQQLEVTLHDPSHELSLTLTGRPAREAPEDSGEGRQVALEFVELDDRQSETLNILIRRVLESHHWVPLDDLRPDSTPREIREALARIPLAHRIALATRAKPRERQFLLHDTHPQVLEALARNPNLLQAEARALAADRALLPNTIELMARDPRWERDDEIKVLLATHARVPLPLAEKLLENLNPLALREALKKPSLNDSMRAKLLRRLSRGTSRR